jgi:hypothetical protein
LITDAFRGGRQVRRSGRGRSPASRQSTPGGPGSTSAAAAGLSPRACRRTFRATGITAYLEAGGTIEKAQEMPADESAKKTKLYDRTEDTITFDEVERIAF